MIAHFEKAKEYLKYPKITLALPDGSPLQLTFAGKGSKFPGTVSMTDGASFGDNKWYGRVTKEGAWEPAKLSEQLKTDLRRSSPSSPAIRRRPRQPTASSPVTAASAARSSPTRSRPLSATARSAPSAGACRMEAKGTETREAIIVSQGGGASENRHIQTEREGQCRGAGQGDYGGAPECRRLQPVPGAGAPVPQMVLADRHRRLQDQLHGEGAGGSSCSAGLSGRCLRQRSCSPAWC